MRLPKDVQDVLDQCHFEIHAAQKEAEACAEAVKRSQAERRTFVDSKTIAIPQDRRPYFEVVEPEPRGKRTRRAAR